MDDVRQQGFILYLDYDGALSAFLAYLILTYLSLRNRVMCSLRSGQDSAIQQSFKHLF